MPNHDRPRDDGSPAAERPAQDTPVLGLPEQALLRLSALADATFEAIFFSEQGICVDLNRRAQELLGVSRDEAIGSDLTTWAVPEHREVVSGNIRAGSEGPYEITALRTDGTTFHCEIQARMIDEDGRRLRITTLRDITRHKRAEAALLESERRNRAFVDAIPDLLFVVDREGCFTDFRCPPGRDLLVQPEDFLGRYVTDVLPAEVAAQTLAAAETVRATGEMHLVEYALDVAGELRHFESRCAVYSTDAVLFIVSEVTETRRLREFESRSQRLETAGRVAGQVAHDFNNLLAPLTGYPELILDTLPPDHEAVEMVRSMAGAAREIAEINQQLLTLGRRGHYNQSPLDLNAVVRQVVLRLPKQPDTVVLDVELAADLLLVQGGAAQLSRAVANLLHNALDALDGSGTLTVATANRLLAEDLNAYAYVPAGEYVRLRIADDGCGIPEAELERIFEPFFTTKTVSRRRGSGLGLSVVEGVVSDHGGYVDLRTAPGRGTVFDVYLPATREPAPAAPDAPRHTGGSVLVVDDEPMQREVSSHLLRRLGYDVRSVASGEAAVEVLRSGPVDLVVLDMVMSPGIDGAETYRRLLELWPGQRAILVSGYSETERVLEAQRLGAAEYVRKPVTPDSLADAVARALTKG